MTLSREIKQKIITLTEHTSKSQRQIAEELGVSRFTVQKTVSLWRETGSVEVEKVETRGRKKNLRRETKK